MGKGHAQRRRAKNALQALREQKGVEVLPPPPKAWKGKGTDFLPRSFREMMRHKAEDEAKQKSREEVKAARQRHAQTPSGNRPAQNLSGNRHAQNLSGNPHLSQNPPSQPSRPSPHPPSASPALSHAANDTQDLSRVSDGPVEPLHIGDSHGFADAGLVTLREDEGHLQEVPTSLGRGYQEGAGPAASLQGGGVGESGLPDEDMSGRTGAEPTREFPGHDGRAGGEPGEELPGSDGRTLAEVFRAASAGMEAGGRKRGEIQGGEQSGHGRGLNPGPFPDAGSRAGFAALYPPTRRVLKRKEYSKLRKLKKKGRMGKDEEPDLETELLVDRYKPKFGEQALAPPTINLKRKPKNTPSKRSFEGFNKTLSAEGGERKKKRKAHRGENGNADDFKRPRTEEIVKRGESDKGGLARGQSGIKGERKKLRKEEMLKRGEGGEKGKAKKAMVVSEGMRSEVVEAYRELMKVKGAKRGRG